MSYIIAVLLLLTPGLAFAETLNPAGSTAWTFYAFGNGEVLWEILQSVSAMVNSEGYRGLAKLLAVSGIAVVAISAGFDPGKAAQKFIGFVIVAFITLYLMFKMTANVIITDPVTGYTNVATGVPAVVGVPAAAISTIGHWLTEKTEQNFSLPDELKVGKGGSFILASALLGDAMKVKVNDPYLRQSMAVYVSDCVIPAMANAEISSNDVLTAGDLWSTIKTTNQGILTVHYSAASPSGTLQSCAEAWTTITTALNSVSNSMLTEGMGAWGSTPAAVGAKLSAASNYMTANNIPLSGSQLIKQTAVVNMFKESYKTAAAKTGNSELMMSMQIAQAEQSQKSSWFMAQELFKSMMGYIYSVLQAFIFAMTPIVLVTLFIPGFGKAVLKNYGQILVWLVLWAPLMAIVSFIVSAYGKQGLTAMAAAKGGYTMETIPVVSEMTNNMTLAGGFLMTMVPMIAWGLVKGAMAFTEFISAGIGSSFASSAASSAATDSLSLNNKSLDNFAANKFNSESSYAVGAGDIKAKLNGAGGASTSRELKPEFLGATAGGNAVTRAKKVDSASTEQDSAALSQGIQDVYNSNMTAAQAKMGQTAMSHTDQFIRADSAGETAATVSAKARAVGAQTAENVVNAYVDATAGATTNKAGIEGRMDASLMGGLNKMMKGAGGDGLVDGLKTMANGKDLAKGGAAMRILGNLGIDFTPSATSAVGAQLSRSGTKSDTTQSSRNSSTSLTQTDTDSISRALATLDTKQQAAMRSEGFTTTDTTTEMAGHQSAASKAIAAQTQSLRSLGAGESITMPDDVLPEDVAKATELASRITGNVNNNIATAREQTNSGFEAERGNFNDTWNQRSNDIDKVFNKAADSYNQAQERNAAALAAHASNGRGAVTQDVNRGIEDSNNELAAKQGALQTKVNDKIESVDDKTALANKLAAGAGLIGGGLNIAAQMYQGKKAFDVVADITDIGKGNAGNVMDVLKQHGGKVVQMGGRVLVIGAAVSAGIELGKFGAKFETVQNISDKLADTVGRENVDNFFNSVAKGVNSVFGAGTMTEMPAAVPANAGPVQPQPGVPSSTAGQPSAAQPGAPTPPQPGMGPSGGGQLQSGASGAVPMAAAAPTNSSSTPSSDNQYVAQAFTGWATTSTEDATQPAGTAGSTASPGLGQVQPVGPMASPAEQQNAAQLAADRIVPGVQVTAVENGVIKVDSGAGGQLSDFQRDAILDSARQAGLNVDDVVDINDENSGSAGFGGGVTGTSEPQVKPQANLIPPVQSLNQDTASNQGGSGYEGPHLPQATSIRGA